jgi:hypothetical protein
MTDGLDHNREKASLGIAVGTAIGAKHQDILDFVFEFSTGDTFGRASRDL